jgi:hypothetical protein
VAVKNLNLKIKISMKKFLLVALVLCCISCENDQTEVRYLGKESPKDIIPFDRITHFEYKGHKYVKFEEIRGYGSVGGVVHDPDCGCFEKEEKEK